MPLYSNFPHCQSVVLGDATHIHVVFPSSRCATEPVYVALVVLLIAGSCHSFASVTVVEHPVEQTPEMSKATIRNEDNAYAQETVSSQKPAVNSHAGGAADVEGRVNVSRVRQK